MKVLLDECLPIGLRHYLSGHVVHSAEWAGFKGKKNGELLGAAIRDGYEVLLTMDRGIPYQQRTEQIAMILMMAPGNQLRHLLPLVESVDLALRAIQPGEIVIVSLPLPGLRNHKSQD